MFVREATFDDHEGIMAVRRTCGLTQRDRPSWEHYWTGNPHWTPGSPIGWVIESRKGRILGTFSTIPVAYQLSGRRLIAGVGNSYAVLPEGRKRSLQVVTQFCHQNRVDLLLSSTPAAMVSELLQKLFGALRAPYPQDTGIFSWITDYGRFAGAVLRRKAGCLAGSLGCLAGPVLWTSDLVQHRHRPGRWPGEVERLEEFDERFDAFWAELAARRPQLIAVRDRATLQWHFCAARTPGRQILALHDGGRMAGYAVLIRKDYPSIGLKRLRICDLETLEDNRSHVEALVSAAIAVARPAGACVVDCMGHDA
ncbi:MAG: hypothetical protein ACYC6Y_17150, partial [Thermoguttaceae bacterium]